MYLPAIQYQNVGLMFALVCILSPFLSWLHNWPTSHSVLSAQKICGWNSSRGLLNFEASHIFGLQGFVCLFLDTFRNQVDPAVTVLWEWVSEAQSTLEYSAFKISFFHLTTVSLRHILIALVQLRNLTDHETTCNAVPNWRADLAPTLSAVPL